MPRLKDRSSLSALEKLSDDLVNHIAGFISDDAKSLIAVVSASSDTHRLFTPALTPSKIKTLLSAIFMGNEALAARIVRENPLILCAKGTYNMPLLNEDGTLSKDTEQSYREVMPLMLSLFTGDWKMWDILYPLIPTSMYATVYHIMQQVKRGGPDLVKIDRDPRTLSWDEIKHFHAGIDESDKPIMYGLLKNPDGIICFTQAGAPPVYFYANPETDEKIVLTPNIRPEDARAFTLFHDRIMNNMIPKYAFG